MRTLLLFISLSIGTAAYAQSTNEDAKACVGESLKNQIRSSVESFEVTSIFDDGANIDMIIAIHFDEFTGQGFVEIRNSDYVNANFLVEGLKPQPVDLSICF